MNIISQISLKFEVTVVTSQSKSPYQARVWLFDAWVGVGVCESGVTCVGVGVCVQVSEKSRKNDLFKKQTTKNGFSIDERIFF